LPQAKHKMPRRNGILLIAQITKLANRVKQLEFNLKKEMFGLGKENWQPKVESFGSQGRISGEIASDCHYLVVLESYFYV
jgi:hypothetical protein